MVIAASERLVALVLAALATYTLADGDAVHVVFGLRCLVRGSITLDAANGLGIPLDRDESFRRLLETFAAGLWR